jgi:septal ring factor EnvC (AmiA/AmiB activator)
METISIALFCTILGVSISYLTFQRNKDNAIRAETREDAETRAKLDYISKGVDDIRLDIKTQDRKINEIIERVAKVEESSKSAHHRIDNIEKEGN